MTSTRDGCASSTKTDTLEAAGREAIARGLRLWAYDIYDPRRGDRRSDDRRCKEYIDSLIRRGLGWTWEPPYAGDGDFEWCGAFAAWCWWSVRPELRRTYFASTYRLDRYASGRSVNGETNDASGRLIARLDEHSTTLPFEARPGDILTIGPAGSGYGKHICLVEAFDGRLFSTIEGNGSGYGPNGERQHGVVRAKRILGGDGWHARRLIRPAMGDLVR